MAILGSDRKQVYRVDTEINVFQRNAGLCGSCATVCVYKNEFPGAENETLSSISYGLVFALVKNVDVC